MPYDPTDAEQAAAVKAAADAVRAETAAQLAKLATEHNSAIEAVRAEAVTAKTALEKATADLATAQADATSTKAERDALAAKVATAAKAADDAVLATVPEALRTLLTGKTGQELADAAKLLAARPPAGPDTSGAETMAPTDADMRWAKANGYDKASPAKIIEASARFGPRAEQAKRDARNKQIATA